MEVRTRTLSVKLSTRIRQFQIVLLFIVTMAMFVTACSEDPSTIGFKRENENIKLVYLDSFTVKISTVALDSIKTSGTGRILAGAFSDSKFGKVYTSSYVDVAPGTWTPDNTALFDSIALILNYDGYYYGDTTRSQKLVVTQLSENITGRLLKDPYVYNDIPYSYFNQEGGLYNHSVTSAYSEILGAITYTPRPLSSDSLHIRLKDDLGANWLALAMKSSDSLVTQSAFNTYFKGFKISSQGPASAVIGFKSATLKARIYYRQVESEKGVYESKEVDFLIYNSTLQYNQVIADHSGTPLTNLVPSTPLPSELTGHVSFVQSGTGLLTKVEFPYLKRIYEKDPNIIVTKATLEVIPVVDEVSTEKELPASIGLYYTNQSNIPMGALASDADASKAQTATLVAQGEYESKAGYAFSMTNYITQLLKKNTVSQYELMLGIPTTEFEKGVNGMRIGDATHASSNIKLKIYYTSYNK